MTFDLDVKSLAAEAAAFFGVTVDEEYFCTLLEMGKFEQQVKAYLLERASDIAFDQLRDLEAKQDGPWANPRSEYEPSTEPPFIPHPASELYQISGA